MQNEEDIPDKRIDFRPLAEEDLELMHKWLNRAHVRKWYYDGRKPTLKEVKEEYLDRTEGRDPVLSYIIELDSEPVGHIQGYRIESYSRYAKAVNLKQKNAVGVDLFIGEKEKLHKGLGRGIIREFLERIVFPVLGADYCIIGPSPDNMAAIKAYEKVGFRYVKTIYNPEDRDKEYIMKLAKKDLKSLEIQE